MRPDKNTGEALCPGEFICTGSESFSFPFLISHRAHTDGHLPALSGYSLLGFFAQWLEGSTRHEDLREHVILHKTLKPRILHLLQRANASPRIHLIWLKSLYKVLTC